MDPGLLPSAHRATASINFRSTPSTRQFEIPEAGEEDSLEEEPRKRPSFAIPALFRKLRRTASGSLLSGTSSGVSRDMSGAGTAGTGVLVIASSPGTQAAAQKMAPLGKERRPHRSKSPYSGYVHGSAEEFSRSFQSFASSASGKGRLDSSKSGKISELSDGVDGMYGDVEGLHAKRERPIRLSNIEPEVGSETSDLSLGVDHMYGDPEEEAKHAAMEGKDGGAPATIVDDETASFDLTKVRMMSVPELPTLAQSPQRERAPSDGVSELSTGSVQEDGALPPPKAEGTAAATGDTLPQTQRLDAMVAPPSRQLTPPLREEENVTRYSWLSYSSKGDNTTTRSSNNNDKTTNNNGLPPKTSSSSKLDKVHIPSKDNSNNGSQCHSNFTDFSEEGNGGLLVGFGRQRWKEPAVPSESSDISSSSSGSSSAGTNDGSEEGFEDGSSGSSSSSCSEEEYSSSEESISLPAKWLDIGGDNQSDMVSRLSFGGASALMYNAQAQSLKSLMNKPGKENEGGGTEGRTAVHGGGTEQRPQPTGALNNLLTPAASSIPSSGSSSKLCSSPEAEISQKDNSASQPLSRPLPKF